MANKRGSILELSDEAMACRSMSHAWKPYTADPHKAKGFKGYNVTLVCDRCDTMKHFMLSERGEYGHPSYTYADDYLLDHPIEPEEKATCRLNTFAGIINVKA